MKRICILLIMTEVLILCVLSVVPALAQTPTNTTSTSPAGDGASPVVFGPGTSNFIPRFLSPNHIGDSNIFQSPSGNIGIGTTSPLFPLVVTNGTGFNSFPSEAFIETEGTDQFTAAIRALAGQQTNNLTFAIDGVTFSPGGIGVQGNHATSGGAFGGGVKGQTSATDGFNFGVWGAALGTTGSGVGVMGTTASPSANAVLGNNPSTTGGGGGGVMGLTNSADFGFSYAVRGTATATTGSALAIFAETFSPNGAAGYFLNRGGGNIIVGHTGINDTLSVFRVDSTGRVFADGGFQPNGADFAESLAVTGDRSKYAPGDLLVIDPTAKYHVALARQSYSTLVAGIYSTKPGLLGATRGVDQSAPYDEVPVAVVGIVPCKVTAENGPIQIGDLLVTSSIPGNAMKGTDRTKMLGAVVGKALEPLQKGTGAIQVLVTLQ